MFNLDQLMTLPGQTCILPREKWLKWEILVLTMRADFRVTKLSNLSLDTISFCYFFSNFFCATSQCIFDSVNGNDECSFWQTHTTVFIGHFTAMVWVFYTYSPVLWLHNAALHPWLSALVSPFFKPMTINCGSFFFFFSVATEKAHVI